MNGTTITDVRIPFGRMVAIILKWMLASIPAIILLYIVMALLSLLMFAVIGGGAVGLGALLDEALPPLELPVSESPVGVEPESAPELVLPTASDDAE